MIRGTYGNYVWHDQAVHVKPTGDTLDRLRSETIYVVDDEASCRSVDSTLRSVGYQVELFSNGLDLLERSKSRFSGCIVMDVRLPGPSGLEIQRRLTEQGSHCPIIFITGHGDIEMAVQAMKAKAVDFLVKPFRDHDLLEAVGRALESERVRVTEELDRELEYSLLSSLSSREYEVFTLLCDGLMGKQIAYILSISEATVKVHRRNILHKLDVPSINRMISKYHKN